MSGTLAFEPADGAPEWIVTVSIVVAVLLVVAVAIVVIAMLASFVARFWQRTNRS